jgi:hypothetical protein
MGKNIEYCYRCGQYKDYFKFDTDQPSHCRWCKNCKSTPIGKYQKVINMWRISTDLRGFTVGKIYEALSVNNFNVELKNDDGDVQYVEKRFLV